MLNVNLSILFKPNCHRLLFDMLSSSVLLLLCVSAIVRFSFVPYLFYYVMYLFSCCYRCATFRYLFLLVYDLYI